MIFGNGNSLRPTPPPPLVWICAATACWAFGFGVQSQAVSHWLNAAGASKSVIGVNHVGYYLGLALASLLVPRLMRVWGPRCAMLGMALSGVCQIVFPWGQGQLGWFLPRFLGGMAGAISVVPLETLISANAPPGQRGRYFAYYGLAITMGGALGIWAGLSTYEAGSVLPFLLGGAAPVLGAGLLLFLSPGRGVQEASSDSPLPWRRNLLSLGTAWYQGFLEGGMLAFLSLFLLTVGFTQEKAGLLMAVTMIGVIAFQVPVAWLADLCGRRTVLLGCYVVVLTGLALVPWRTGLLELGVLLFLIGACSGAMYPLGLAILGEGLAESQVPRAYAWYLALECLGSQFGAGVMGMALDVFGDASMFLVGLAAGCGVLGLAWLGRCRGSAATSDYVSLAGREAA